MIAWYIKRAFQDLHANRFVNAVTLMTVALLVLIVSTALLFFLNTGDMLEGWKKDTRIMGYLGPGAGPTAAARLRPAIEAIDGVGSVRFVPREEALDRLKDRMKHQASLFENLTENPLPDAFEIRLRPTTGAWAEIGAIAARIGALPGVEEVEYGHQWVQALRGLVGIFQVAAAAMTGLFLVAAVSIVANTTRLVIYSRRQEVEIMRLVGATEWFIKVPFYIEGLIHGFCGAVIGLAVLFAAFNLTAARMDQGVLAGLLQVRFLPPQVLLGVTAASMLVGALGCHLSLRQFLRS
jgi:cell division transport system permease protein